MNPSVVEPVEVVERGPFDVLDVAPRSLAMDELGLVEAVERLGERIIVTVALRANGRDDLRLAETLGVANAEVLTEFNRWKQHLLIQLIVDARQVPRLVSSNQESFEVSY